MSVDWVLVLAALAVFAAMAGIVWRITQFIQGLINGVTEGRTGKVLEQRGFEVKLNSGAEPETKKKENDHG